MNPWRGPTALSRSKADPTARPGINQLIKTYYARPTGPPEGEML